MQPTDEQVRIIEAPDTHMLVTAVAGSGKTTTLIGRILHLLGTGIDARRIRVLMFNRKARDEFAERLSRKTHHHPRALPEILTYHAFGNRIRKLLVDQGHLPTRAEPPMSDGAIDAMMWECLRHCSRSDTIFEQKQELIALARTLMDLSKSTLQSANLVFEACPDMQCHPILIKAVEEFDKRCQSGGLLTYADMLHDPAQCLLRQPALQALVANHLDILIVDEYQDTNAAQHALLQIIAGNRARVTLVGDADQTIYEFAGARTDFILRTAQQDFRPMHRYALSASFRYGPEVAAKANALIAHNKDRFDQRVISHCSASSTTFQILERQASGRNRVLARHLQNCLADGEATVLLRVWAQAAAIELLCLENDLPYRIEQSRSLTSQLPWNQVRALLSQAISGGTAPGTMQPETLSLLLTFPTLPIRRTLLSEFAHAAAHTNAEEALRHVTGDLHANLVARLLKRYRLIQSVGHWKGGCSELFDLWARETNLYGNLETGSLQKEKGLHEARTVRTIIDWCKLQGVSPRHTLTRMDALAAQHRERGSSTEPRQVLITTVHKAKGLEWDHVIIPDVDAATWPYRLEDARDPEAHLEGERRLLYVAVTRGIRSVCLQRPAPSGQNERDATRKPSSFCQELDPEPTMAASVLDQPKRSWASYLKPAGATVAEPAPERPKQTPRRSPRRGESVRRSRLFFD